MEYVGKRNSEITPAYEIPKDIEELFVNQLGCITAGNAQHGLRWEHKGIRTVFFENIKRDHCDIYILPTSDNRAWKTIENLRKIITKSGLSHLMNKAQYGGGHDRKHLRIRNVSWKDLKILSPELVKWVYVSETGKDFAPKRASLQPEWPPKNPETYLDECEKAAATLGHQAMTELKRRAIANGKKNPRYYDAQQRIYERSIEVIEFCRMRAKYQCEIEKCDYTPFVKFETDEVYIETHHINPLSEKGEDTIDNVGCLCPNHHKEIHYGENRARLIDELLQKRKQSIPI